MSEKNTDDFYPDLSGIFDIDDKDIPNVLIKRPEADTKPASSGRARRNSSAERTRGTQRILTAEQPNGRPTREELAKRRREKRDAEIRKAKTRAILILSAALIVLIGGIAIKAAILNSKMPVAELSKATIEKMDRTYEASAAVLKNPLGINAVLIDNDYDVHYIEKKQHADITTADGNIFNGTVEKIQEEDRESDYFKKLISILLKEEPETSVYSVYITINDPEGILKDGQEVNVKIYTKSVDKALTVPSTAIYTDGNQSYVWLYHSVKKVLSKQDVTTGITADGKTEITAGIEKNDIVISSISCPPEELYNGIKVKTN